MSVPNFITIARFFLIPAFIFLMLEQEYRFAVFVFIFAGLTDVLDGYMARKYNMVTKLGKILDPLADKLLQITALIMLVVTDLVPNILPVILIVAGKELLMGIGSVILWKIGIVVAANWYGKASTFIFYTAIILSILIPGYGMYFLTIAVISAIYAFLMYYLNYLKIRRSYYA